MKRIASTSLCIFALAFVVCAQTERSVSAIRERYNDIAEKARLCESDEDRGQFGDLFLNTLNINSRNHQWRAVGIYGQTYRFFYKQVDDERRLYPDQLVFVKTERRVSDRIYFEEYLYSDNGALMFYFQKAENDAQLPSERRVYFLRTKVIRVAEDSKTRDRITTKDAATAKEILTQSRKIQEIFTRSINL